MNNLYGDTNIENLSTSRPTMPSNHDKRTQRIAVENNAKLIEGRRKIAEFGLTRFDGVGLARLMDVVDVGVGGGNDELDETLELLD